MKAKILSKSGSLITFRIESSEPITPETAQDAQKAAGYDPRGYGFYAFKTFLPFDDQPVFAAIWSCSTSCD